MPNSAKDSDAKKIVTEKLQVLGVPMVALFGTEDKLLKTLEQTYPQVEVHARGNEVVLKGPASQLVEAKKLIEEMVALIANGQDLAPQDFTRSAKILES